MIKAIEALPTTRLGDIIEVNGQDYLVINILSIFKDNDPELDPTISYKLILEPLIFTSTDN